MEPKSIQDPAATLQDPAATLQDPAAAPKPKDSFVKLAMRNMVRKSRQSLVHFGLTSLGLMAVLLGLAFLTRH